MDIEKTLLDFNTPLDNETRIQIAEYVKVTANMAIDSVKESKALKKEKESLLRQIDFMWEQIVESGTCPNWLRNELERCEAGILEG